MSAADGRVAAGGGGLLTLLVEFTVAVEDDEDVAADL